MIASLGGVLTAVLVLATAASLVVADRMAASASSEHGAKLVAQAALRDAEANRREAESARDRAERSLYAARMGQAEGSLRLLDSGTARALLDQCIPEPGKPDRRGWEWYYLDQWCRPELRTLKLTARSESNVVAVSPDGRSLVVAGETVYSQQKAEKTPVPMHLIDLKYGKLVSELASQGNVTTAVAFRPDGKRFATAGDNGITVWNSDTMRQRPNLRGPGVQVLCVSWSPDGHRLASSDKAGLVQIWDPETGEESARISHSGARVAWSPDGTRIATAGSENQVRIWAAADQQPIGPVLSPGGNNGICWAPDGRRLAGIAGDGTLTLWDSRSGHVLFSVKQTGALRSVAFSPDGERLATGGVDGIIRLYEAESGEERATLLTDSQNVSSLAFHPDGRRLFAAGAAMHGVKVFDADRNPRGRAFTPWLDQLVALSFVDDSDRLHGIGWQGGHLVSPVFSAGGMRFEGSFPVTDAQGWPRSDMAFSIDGRQLAAPLKRDRSVVGIWDVSLGRLTGTVRENAATVSAVAFSPDGRRLATGASVMPAFAVVVTIWDLDSGRAVRSFDRGRGRIDTLAFDRDSKKLAAGGHGIPRDSPGWVTVWNTASGAVLGVQDDVGVVKSVAFHPDGASLAIADYGHQRVHLWDFAAGTLITRTGPRGSVAWLSRPTASGWHHWATRATSTWPTPEPSSRCWCSGALAHPLAPAAGRRGSPSAPTVRGSRPTRPILSTSGKPARRSMHRSSRAPTTALGWLRRSRSFAAQEHVSASQAAFERALAIPTDSPEPWIRHGLARGIEPAQAEMALARAFAATCEDPILWLVCARELERSDRKHEAGVALERARVLAEKRLVAAPDDEPASWALADILKDGMTAIPDGNWVILEPSEMTSSGGATLTRLPDGSILASGKNPVRDTLTLVARTELASITGLRLEVIPDPRLPTNGPGRHFEKGHLHLTELSAAVAPGNDRSRARSQCSPHRFRHVIEQKPRSQIRWP